MDVYWKTLNGLNCFSEKDIKSMHYNRKDHIVKRHRKAQREINIFKQERIIQITNSIFKMFTNSKLASDIINLHSEPDPKYFSNMNFQDLNMSKEDIAQRLVEKNILPNNFYNL